MFEKTTLPNGLRIVTSTMPETRSVSINVFVGAGSRYENDMEAGVSHFLEHMLFKGTHRFPTSKEISDTIEGVGGYMNAATEKELTVYWCKVARPHFNSALDLLSDIILHSKFEKKDWEKERQVILEELKSTDDMPQQRVDFMIDELVWPGHPMGRDVGGSRDSVQAMPRETAIKYMGQQYVPNNIVVSVAGNITHKEVVDKVARHMGDMKRGRIRHYAPAHDGQELPVIKFEERKAEQTHLCLGVRAMSARNPERHALDLLNVVLGEGMSSRLFLEIREELGLAYEVSSGVSHFLDTGSLVVYAGVDPNRLAEALQGVMKQMKNIKKPVTKAELKRAKELSKGRTLMRMEDTRAVAGWLGIQELLLNRIRTVDEVVTQIDKVKIDQMQEAVEKVLVPGKLNLAIVGPLYQEKQVRELIENAAL